jgi:DNA (cytosine-5)-methyltransferase 1
LRHQDKNSNAMRAGVMGCTAIKGFERISSCVQREQGRAWSKSMKSIELFAGAGGLGLGIEKAGFDHSVVIERDPDACATVRFNFSRPRNGHSCWPLHEIDVRQFDFSRFEDKVELVSGGPPCQPFSIGGKHRGFNDSRDMFPEAARVVRTVRPKAFIFENVRGLLRRSFAKYFEYVLLQLTYPEIVSVKAEDWSGHLSRLERHHTKGQYSGLHYRVAFRLVNAADYGVPQKRERVVIVGFRSDIGEHWSFPATKYSEDALLFSQWVTHEYWDNHRISRKNRPLITTSLAQRVMKMEEPKGIGRWQTVRDAITDLPNPGIARKEEILNHCVQPGARIYPGHTGSPLDFPAKTLKAGDHGVPGGENMLALADGTVRYFTVRESARLQTFPDWFAFPCSWTESMRQIGNAVPVRLSETIAKSVADVLQQHQDRIQTDN